MRTTPHYTQEYIEQNLQMALQNHSEWCKLNGMLLNTDKTKAMLVTTSQKRLHLNNDILHLTYNNDVLNSVENEKVLGVHIDNNLTWPIHINFIAKKISSNLWLLSKGPRTVSYSICPNFDSLWLG